MCFYFLYKFVWNISHSKRNPVRYYKKIYLGLQVKYFLLLSDFNETWTFLAELLKIKKYQTSWKSVQWQQTCSLQTDRLTDMTELIVPFCSFSKTTKRTVLGVKYTSWVGHDSGGRIPRAATPRNTQMWWCLATVWHIFQHSTML
jgi:hypothetical protein